MIKLSPSILAADPLRLGQAARMAQDAGCDELHFDVMDGHFVPNLTFGPHILKAMKQEFPQIVYDVHLMLDNPAEFVDPFIDAGADILTVHAEADGFGGVDHAATADRNAHITTTVFQHLRRRITDINRRIRLCVCEKLH